MLEPPRQAVFIAPAVPLLVKHPSCGQSPARSACRASSAAAAPERSVFKSYDKNCQKNRIELFSRSFY